MSGSTCPFEDEVQRALADGQWSDGLRSHAAGCPVCSDLMTVATFMVAHSDELAGDHELPDPSYLFWRAQLQARADAAERAMMIITIVQRIAMAGGGILAALGLFRLWPAISRWLVAITPTRISSPLPADVAPPGLVILACVGVLGGWLLFDAYERWSERRASSG